MNGTFGFKIMRKIFTSRHSSSQNMVPATAPEPATAVSPVACAPAALQFSGALVFVTM